MGWSREKLYGEVANMTVFEPLLMDIYKKEEEKIWRQEDKSPHGRSWNLSFHGSAFPGDDDSVCGRAQVYNLMNPAPEKPFDPFVRAMFDVGLDLEHNWVRRLSAFGVLLSNDVTGEDDYQTNLEDKEYWLTGSPDAIILPPFRKKCSIVEIKTTSLDKVKNMQSDPSNVPASHRKYLRQLKLYIALAHEKFSPSVFVCRVSGTLIKKDKCNHDHLGECDPVLIRVIPPDDGTLIYSSREEPLNTVSYYAGLDLDFLKSGREKLAKWKQLFIEGKIPEHVHEGQSAKWSVGECSWCSWKREICKPDYKDKVIELSKSNLIKYTKSIRPNYDAEKTRRMVLNHWGINE